MNNKIKPIKEGMLVSYLLGELSQVDGLVVESWAKAHPDHQRQLEDFKTILENGKLQHYEEVDAHLALERLNHRLSNAGPSNAIRYNWILKIAAILLVLTGCGIFFYQNLIANKVHFNSQSATVSRILPDGSTAILNERSSLSFVGGFFEHNRVVKLKGEGFFKVKADKNKPFIIMINNVKVSVVGTAFNVRGEGNSTEVIVESGLVNVNHGGDSISLSAGEKVEIDQTIRPLVKSKNNGQLYNFYYSGELICNSTPLSELVEVLNRKFKSNIVIQDQDLLRKTITTKFKNESLQEILEVIADTFRLQVEYGEHSIKLN